MRTSLAIMLVGILLAAASAQATRVELLDGMLVVEVTHTTSPSVDARVTSTAGLDIRTYQGCSVTPDGPASCGGFTNAHVADTFAGLHAGCLALSTYRGARCDITAYPGEGSGIFVAPEFIYTYYGDTWPAGVCYRVSASTWECNYVAITEEGATVCVERVYWGASTDGFLTRESLACLTP